MQTTPNYSNISRSLLYIIPLGGVSDGQLAEILVQDTEKE